jgi:hypothetical protein
VLSQEEVDRQMAEYERQLRAQLLREHEDAELLARHRDAVATKRFLPVIGSSVGAGSAPATLSA